MKIDNELSSEKRSKRQNGKLARPDDEPYLPLGNQDSVGVFE